MVGCSLHHPYCSTIAHCAGRCFRTVVRGACRGVFERENETHVEMYVPAILTIIIYSLTGVQSQMLSGAY